jgi:gluconate:H+ symporter, GntP family
MSGSTIPLLLIVIPPAVIIPLWIGLRDIRAVDEKEMTAILPRSFFPEFGWRLYLPLAVVVGLMLGQRLLVKVMPDIGIPGIFMVGSLLGLVCGRRFNLWAAARKAVDEAMPILAILAGVGMFIQVMTLTGARGWIVMALLSCRAGFSIRRSPWDSPDSEASRPTGRAPSWAFPSFWP